MILHSISSQAFSRTRRRSVAAIWLALVPGLIGVSSASGQAHLATLKSTDHAAAPNAAAYQALQEGRVDDATTLLRARLAANPSDVLAHQLQCRVFYAQSMAEDAIRECELAVSSPGADAAQDSDNQLWLGRAYGLKARHAGPLAGFKLARKVQSSFARAVELNPASVPALNDLGEYDVNAPFIVGGGIDKAQALAARMMPSFAGPAHMLLARIAVSNKDNPTAEAEFKEVVAIEKSAAAWVDLADFYVTHGRPDDAVAAVKSALALDHSNGPVLVDAASVLIAAHREPDLAERCLREYLASHAKTDAAPAFKVHLQLAKLLAARGDAQSASREVEAAATLAPGFSHSGRQSQGL